MDPFDLLVNGNLLDAVRSVLEQNYSYYIWLVIAMVIIIATYIKSDSLLITSLVSFVLLIGITQIISISLIPLIAVFMVFFISLIVYDVFIKGR